MTTRYKVTVESAFDIHDRATKSGRVGRVRQTISADINELISEVDLEVGMISGFPGVSQRHGRNNGQYESDILCLF
jgi:hypothetical protein